MKRITWIAMGVSLLLANCGCLARQVHHDGTSFRNAVNDMYTDQVMDNLIRAHDGMPFVQLKFRDLSIQDEDTVGASTQQVNLDQNATTFGLKLVPFSADNFPVTSPCDK